MRYLSGTKKVYIFFRNRDACVEGYTNTNYARDMDKRRYTPGYVFMFSGGVVSW